MSKFLLLLILGQIAWQPQTTDDWTWLGPSNFTGRVNSLVAHPSQPNRFLAATVGGIWKSINGGVTWQIANEQGAVSSLANVSSQPDTFYAVVDGRGILKTLDGGNTWQLLAPNSAFQHIRRLAVASNGTLLLVATLNGLYRSSNGGNTWLQILTNSNLYDVNIGANPNKAMLGGDGGYTAYSIDGGQSWLSSNVTWTQRVELTYSPSNSNIVFASLEQNGGEIWYSSNGGMSFSRMSTGFNYLANSSSDYNNLLWIDPLNNANLLVAGTTLWSSRNGGITLTPLNNLTSNPRGIMAAPTYDGTTNRTVLVATDQGVFKTTDISTGSDWQPQNQGLGISELESVIASGLTNILLVSQRSQGLLRSDGSSQTWQSLANTSGQLALDTLVTTYFYDSGKNLTIKRSLNGGQSLENIYQADFTFPLGDANSPTRTLESAPIAYDAGTLLAGGASLWRTFEPNEAFPRWQAIKPPLANANCRAVNQCISAIAFARNQIWLGYQNGLVYQTQTANSFTPTWSLVTGLPLSHTVNRIVFSPHKANDVYIASDDGLWYTQNAGLTWQAFSNLPQSPIYDVSVHPLIQNWLYAATGVGLYQSKDSGITWQLAGPNELAAKQLAWQADSLLVATGGRGLFRTATTTNLPILTGQNVQIADDAGNANGQLDPGEYIDLQIILHNVGMANATNVQSSLVVNGSGAIILNGLATYLAIAAGLTATSQTAFRLKVNPDQLCGKLLYLTQYITVNQNISFVYNFSLTVGAAQSPSQVVYSYEGMTQPIADATLNGLEIPIIITQTGWLNNIKIRFNLEHTYDSDLQISLLSPTNQRIRLANRRGGSGDNFNNTVLYDMANLPISSGVAPFDGDFQPEQPVAVLVGQPIAGTWRLQIQDVSLGDVGNFVSWSLEFSRYNYTCSLVNSNPLPMLSRLDPISATIGTPAFELRLIGADFLNTSQVLWNDTSRPTTFVSSTELTVGVTEADTAVIGTAQLRVSNPLPGGGVSYPLTFTVMTLCNPQIVTKSVDDNSCGTLRYALSTSQLITVSVPMLTLMASLEVPNGTTINGVCTGGVPQTVINGNNTQANGLILNGATYLYGLKIVGFRGYQIRSLVGNNRLACVRATSSNE